MRYMPFLLILLASTCVFAQKSLWKTSLTNDVVLTIPSPDGAYLIIVEDNRGDLLVRCLETKSGHALWSKTATNFPALPALIKRELWRFLDNRTLFLGMNGRHEWINPTDGSIYASIPIIGETWRDMIAQDQPNYQIGPVMGEGWACFYFDDGTQILDLSAKSVIYSGPLERSHSSGLTGEEVSGDIIVFPCDSLLYFDTSTKTIVFKDKPQFNSTVYSHFFSTDKSMLLFNEDNIPCIDLKTGRVDALIPVDPDDPDYYRPIIVNNELRLLAGIEETQRLYDSKSGRLLWETKKGELPGFIDMVIPIDATHALCSYYSLDKDAGLAAIDLMKGSIVWKKKLVRMEDEYEPGHRRKSGLAAMSILNIVTSVALTAVSRASVGPQGGFYNVYNVDLSGQLYKMRRSAAHIRLLGIEGDEATFLLAGQYEPYAEFTPPGRENSREHILTVNLKDGRLVQTRPTNAVAGIQMENYNAVGALDNDRLFQLQKGTVVVGEKQLTVYSKGKTHSMAFGFAETISYISSNEDTMIVRSHNPDNDDIPTRYWRLLLFQESPVKQLIGRATKRYFRNSDYMRFPMCIDISDEEIRGYDIVNGDVPASHFKTPKWRYTLEALGTGDLKVEKESENPSVYPIQGVEVSTSGIVVMGDDGLACISPEGGCTWKKEWDVSISNTRLGALPLGSSFAYATGADVSIHEFACPGRLLYHAEVPFRELEIRQYDGQNVFYTIRHGEWIEAVSLP